MDEYLLHFGVGHDDAPPGPGSGRLPWGSGENPGQHQYNFISEVSAMKKRGLSDGEIAKVLLGEHEKANDLKAALTIAKAELRTINRNQAIQMVKKCNGNVSEAARRLGMKNESSLRSLINKDAAENRDRYRKTADMLRKAVDEKGIIDVSSDANFQLGVTKNTMDVAVSMLRQEGYIRTYIKLPQANAQHETSVKVLAKPDMTYGEIQKNRFNVQPITNFTPDEGFTWWTPKFPTSVNSKRIKVRYKEEGGDDMDGVIEIRPGVKDLSLEGSMYSQVRIAVDGTHYMKGMAVYGIDMPDGIDIIYNSNKKKGTPLIGEPDHEVLKRMKVNPDTGEIDVDNPFGALIRSPKSIDGVLTAGGQHYYADSDGKEKLSPINKLRDEGDWERYSKTLSSQFLSKQPLKLINQQIALSIEAKRKELASINELTNSVIRQKMLDDFASNCDSAANSLAAKGFKNQAYQVFLPVPGLKDGECYAPRYKNGEVLALIRYPHAGPFEIPILKVNNRNSEAIKRYGTNIKDAIGINKRTADIMSGADFDGDFGVAIPIKSNNLSIKSMDPLFDSFDTKSYSLPDSAPRINPQTKQIQMGIVSNLITDMTIGGANYKDIAKAVKHSMVVIDSEKHHLDYKRSARVNDIEALKAKYQGINPDTGHVRGASTVISQAGSEAHIPERKLVTDTRKMSPSELERWEQGYQIYQDTGRTMKRVIKDPSKMTPSELELYKSGKKVYRDTDELATVKVSRMSIVDDARSLVRDTSNKKEMAYANYANDLKSMAREARIQSRSIKPIPVNPSAKISYAKEIESLNSKLNLALSNNPKERAATAIHNAIMSEKLKANPSMDAEHRKRERALAMTKARAIVGAKKKKIEITPSEWDAIQANAISTAKLKKIINNSDLDVLKELATPKRSSGLTSSQISRISNMYASGKYTLSEIAERFGISPSTVSSILNT